MWLFIIFLVNGEPQKHWISIAHTGRQCQRVIERIQTERLRISLRTACCEDYVTQLRRFPGYPDPKQILFYRCVSPVIRSQERTFFAKSTLTTG